MLADELDQVPCLTTALDGPLLQLEQECLTKQTKIEAWFRQQWAKTPAPIYSSVDLRNAGFKLAPVDTNLFSAGFNNLNPEFIPLCIQAAQVTLEKAYPGLFRILLIPENHTRNQFYLKSLAVLHDILSKAGYDVRLGSLIAEESQTISLDDGQELQIEPIYKEDSQLRIANFIPELVLLNNDMSSGIPPILQGVEQPIRPVLDLGWASRLKSDHFRHYQQVCQEFAELLGIDPWLIDPLFSNCGEVDFMKGAGIDCLEMKVAELLQQIQSKYDQYGITQKPFVVVKADSGTYGMGIMMVHDVAELRQLNRKQRTRMSTQKGSKPITQVIIQEGVYTFETWGEEKAVAEPVVYMLGQFVVGGFYRVHTKRSASENLNAPGMHFEPLAFVNSCNNPCYRSNSGECANRFYAYGVIARLALVAAAYELQATQEKTQ